MPFLGFNLAETTSAWPSQAQQKYNSAKAPTVEAEGEENPAQGKSQEAQRAGNRSSKNALGRKLTRLSLRLQKTSCWGRKSLLLWLEGYMANTILNPLQPLNSCFLKPLQTGEGQWVPQDVLKALLSAVS